MTHPPVKSQIHPFCGRGTCLLWEKTIPTLADGRRQKKLWRNAEQFSGNPKGFQHIDAWNGNHGSKLKVEVDNRNFMQDLDSPIQKWDIFLVAHHALFFFVQRIRCSQSCSPKPISCPSNFPYIILILLSCMQQKGRLPAGHSAILPFGSTFLNKGLVSAGGWFPIKGITHRISCVVYIWYMKICDK